MSAPIPDPRTKREVLLDAYVGRTTTLLSGLALVYLALFSLQSIYPNPGADWYSLASAFGTGLWVLFATDLTFRFLLSDEKRHFFRRNWLDTITVVVPQLRALRALRAFTRNGILAKKGKGVLSGQALTTAALGTLIVVWVGSLMVLNTERGTPGAQIENFGDAMWWAMQTVTTVGYGDLVPVTPAGQIIAVLVMVVGISILGVVSASLAATLVKQVPTTPDTGAAVLQELAELRELVTSLREEIAATRPRPTASSPVQPPVGE
jgi:voltage-gated potassium channel